MGCPWSGQWGVPVPVRSRGICGNKEDDFDEINYLSITRNFVP